MSVNLIKVGICQILLFIATYCVGLFFLFESEIKAPYEGYDLLINLIFGFVFFKLARTVTEFLSPSIVYSIYNGDFEQFNSDLSPEARERAGMRPALQQDAQEAANQEGPMEEFEFTILNTPEKPLGKFLGEDFFEWIDVEDEYGNKIRLSYLGTVDPNTQPEIQRGTVIMHPGVIYSVSVEK